MSDLKLKLGKRIQSLRKSQNITQEKLAEIIDMDITSLFSVIDKNEEKQALKAKANNQEGGDK